MAPLAWQSSSAMSANGGANTGTDIPASNQGPAQGTEYTLQGMCGHALSSEEQQQVERAGLPLRSDPLQTRLPRPLFP